MTTVTEETADQDLPQMLTSQPDWLLQRVVEYANRFNLQTSITLQTGGMLVSGNIIGGATYFKKFSEGFGDALARVPGFEEASESSRKLFGSYKSLYEYPEDGGAEIPGPTFIHLENVRFVVPGNRTLNVGEESLWRGRISEISGFTFSTFS